MQHFSHVFNRKPCCCWVGPSVTGSPVQKAMPLGARICRVHRKGTSYPGIPGPTPSTGARSPSCRTQHEAQIPFLILSALMFPRQRNWQIFTVGCVFPKGTRGGIRQLNPGLKRKRRKLVATRIVAPQWLNSTTRMDASKALQSACEEPVGQHPSWAHSDPHQHHRGQRVVFLRQLSRPATCDWTLSLPQAPLRRTHQKSVMATSPRIDIRLVKSPHISRMLTSRRSCARPDTRRGRSSSQKKRNRRLQNSARLTRRLWTQKFCQKPMLFLSSLAPLLCSLSPMAFILTNWSSDFLIGTQLNN